MQKTFLMLLMIAFLNSYGAAVDKTKIPFVFMEIRNKDIMALQVKIEGNIFPVSVLSLGCALGEKYATNQQYGIKIPCAKQGRLAVDDYLMTVKSLTDDLCGQCWLTDEIVRKTRIMYITTKYVSIFDQSNKIIARLLLEK